MFFVVTLSSPSFFLYMSIVYSSFFFIYIYNIKKLFYIKVMEELSIFRIKCIIAIMNHSYKYVVLWQPSKLSTRHRCVHSQTPVTDDEHHNEVTMGQEGYEHSQNKFH